MRIAVTYENGYIFQHFGHTAQFKIYDVQDGQVVASQVVDTNGSGHGALAALLSGLNADALICGGIGGGAAAAAGCDGQRRQQRCEDECKGAMFHIVTSCEIKI